MSKKTKKDYPSNWLEISERIKQRDGWQCQRCSRKFLIGCNAITVIINRKLKKRRLTVHHKDRNTWNNSDENLISLCCACHCKEELPLIRAEIAKKKTEQQVKNGQTLLFD